MRRDHRPYVIKKAYLQFQRLYVRRYLRPQLAHLGRGAVFMKPWHVELFGGPIAIGDCATVIATPDRRVRLSIWPAVDACEGIRIGRYCLICPGVRIGCAARVIIGNNTMLASGVYITDADWHGVYDRMDMGETAPVTIGENDWIGDGSIVCKGISIGDNSVIGAGAVVVKDVPANVVAAGNPARVVKHLEAERRFTTREDWYTQSQGSLARDFDALDRLMLRPNTFRHWLRHLVFPSPRDY